MEEKSRKFIRLEKVKEITSLERSTIYKRMSEKSFPKHANLGGNIVAWEESEILAWVDQRLAERRPI